VVSTVVPSPVPITAGMPYSRATIAACEASPPWSTTTAAARVNSGVQDGLVAVQTLWAGPWMIRVSGYTPLEAATGLFYINATMLVTFWSWGMVNPWLSRHGWGATRLITWGVPFSLTVLAINIAAGPSTGWLGWALFCMGCSAMGLAQPAVGMAFKPSQAGRALSAYNLMIFAGVFTMQWGIGLLIDVFAALGLAQVASFQAAMGVFLCCCIASYGYFISVKADNSPQ